MDDLTYNYIDGSGNAGNQVQTITDAGTDNDNVDDYTASATGNYTYDANGNMTTDPGKNTSIIYNYLNLPQEVSSNNDAIFYHYDAAGNKLAKLVKNGASTLSLTHYEGNIVYNGDQIAYVITSEGRILPEDDNGTTTWRYEYDLKDNLGNTRVCVSDLKLPGTAEVMQYSNYYPFGLVYEQSTSAGSASPNKYLYNGKEIQDDMLDGVKLGWYDYRYRFYDPAIARFNSIDRFAMNYPYKSPYDYAENKPVNSVDLDGLEAVFSIEAAMIASGGASTSAVVAGHNSPPISSDDIDRMCGKVQNYVRNAEFTVLSSVVMLFAKRTAAQKSYGQAHSQKQTNAQKNKNNNKNQNSKATIAAGVTTFALALYINMKLTNNPDAFDPSNSNSSENADKQSNKNTEDSGQLVVQDNNKENQTTSSSDNTKEKKDEVKFPKVKVDKTRVNTNN